MRLLLVALAALLLGRDCAAIVYPNKPGSRCELSPCACFRFPVGCVQERCCNVCSPCDGDPGDGLDFLSSGGDTGPGPSRREDATCGRDNKMSSGVYEDSSRGGLGGCNTIYNCISFFCSLDAF